MRLRSNRPVDVLYRRPRHLFASTVGAPGAPSREGITPETPWGPEPDPSEPPPTVPKPQGDPVPPTPPMPRPLPNQPTM